MIKSATLIVIFAISLAACGSLGAFTDPDNNCRAEAGSVTFTIAENSKTLLMDGVIDCSTPQKLWAMLDRYPIEKIVMLEVEGSTDDWANLGMAKTVSEEGLAIEVADNGYIASGGVDFFLAGLTRKLGRDVAVGVHAWGDESGNSALKHFRRYPKSQDHRFYIEYYSQFVHGLKDGRPGNEWLDAATDFYAYTLESAPVDSIHCMTAQELVDWGIVTNTRNPRDLTPRTAATDPTDCPE